MDYRADKQGLFRRFGCMTCAYVFCSVFCSVSRTSYNHFALRRQANKRHPLDYTALNMSSRKSIAIIAGAGPGTGAAVAHAFARKGYAVALLARTPSKLSGLESQITSAGGTAASFPADLTQRASLTSAFASISETFGADAPVKVSPISLPFDMHQKNRLTHGLPRSQS